MTQTEDAPKPTPKAPDGGWSWVVIACAFYNAMILIGISVTFGIVFNEKLTMMGVSSTTTSWMFNLFSFNFAISTLFAGPVSDVFSWRSMGFVTAIIAGVAYALMVFASGPGLIFLLYSVVVGLSAGLASYIAFLVIPHYFDHHRGRAGAIVMVGVSLSQAVIPLLMRHLQDEYGFYGGCLLFSGLIFNCAVTCLLFYPVLKRPLLKGDLIYEAAKKKQETQLSLETKRENKNRVRKLNEKRLDSSQSPREKMKEILRITWLHTCQLKRITVLIVSLSFAILIVGYGNLTALLPFAIADQDHPATVASYSLSVGAAANTAVRIFVSWASDANWFNRKVCYIFGSVLSGASAIATVFVLHDSHLIMACQIFWGIGVGASLSVFHNVVIDTCGRDLYDAGVSCNGLLKALCSIVLGPLLGVAKDFTSYKVAIGLAGAFHLMCAGLWVFMPLARKYDTKNFPDRQATDEIPEKKTSEASTTEVSNHKCEEAGYINHGFIANSAISTYRRNSVC